VKCLSKSGETAAFAKHCTYPVGTGWRLRRNTFQLDRYTWTCLLCQHTCFHLDRDC